MLAASGYGVSQRVLSVNITFGAANNTFWGAVVTERALNMKGVVTERAVNMKGGMSRWEGSRSKVTKSAIEQLQTNLCCGSCHVCKTAVTQRKA